MSSSTEPRRGRTRGFALALAGFVLCDGVALVALGNVVGFWDVNTTVLFCTLVVGVACLIGGMKTSRRV